ncbi:zinc finger, CCHC-type containing protein [Tanacetum coccineum]
MWDISLRRLTTGNSSKKDNLSMSNSFSALNEEEEEDEEDVENVYDELANLIQNTKAGGSSSFTAAAVIMEYLVKISKKARILELKRRNMKKLILTSYTPYPSRKIWCICACTSLKTTKEQGSIRRLSHGLWGEAMLTTCYLLNMLPNKRNRIGHAEYSQAFRFSSIPRPSQSSLISGTGDIGGSVVFEKVTEEVVVQQPEPQLKKSKRNKTLKNFGHEFQLYLIEGIRDEVSDQYSCCFNVEDDPKTFNKAGCCKPLDDKWIFKIKLKVDGTIEKFKDGLVIQGIRVNSRIYYFNTYAPVTRISTIRMQIALASIHNVIIHEMNVKTSFLNGELEEEVDQTKELLSLRFSMMDMWEADVILDILNMKYSYGYKPDISFAVGKVISFRRIPDELDRPILKDNSSTQCWGVGKEDEWLRNLILEIPLWSKPIAHISISCDSAVTLAKAYSQMYKWGGIYRVCEISTKR